MPCLETLKKLFENILAHKGEDKYKIIKRSNKVIQQKVYGVDNIETFLVLVGYEPVDEDLLKFTGEYSQLEDARNQVVVEVRKLTPVTVKPEGPVRVKTEKDKLLEEQQRKFKEELLAKKRYMEQLEKQMKLDRLDKRQEPKPTASVARQLKYGAQIHKMEHKAEPRAAPRG